MLCLLHFLSAQRQVVLLWLRQSMWQLAACWLCSMIDASGLGRLSWLVHGLPAAVRCRVCAATSQQCAHQALRRCVNHLCRHLTAVLCSLPPGHRVVSHRRFVAVGRRQRRLQLVAGQAQGSSAIPAKSSCISGNPSSRARAPCCWRGRCSPWIALQKQRVRPWLQDEE